MCRILITAVLVLAGAFDWSHAQEASESRYSYHCSWGRHGDGSNQGQFRNPSNLSFYRDKIGRRTLLLSDTDNGRVKWVSYIGQFYEQLEKTAGGAHDFESPAGSAFDDSGCAWICDPPQKCVVRVQVWTSKVNDRPGDLVTKLSGDPGTDAFLARPVDVDVDKHGHVYVVDQGDGAVKVFDLKGRFLRSIGTGHLEAPSGIAVNRFSECFVADSARGTVTAFDASGGIKASWGSRGARLGQFEAPGGLCIGVDDQVLVADTANHRIQVFSRQGQFVQAFGSKGSRAGEFNSPSDIVADEKGAVYIADRGNHRYQRFVPSK